MKVRVGNIRQECTIPRDLVTSWFGMETDMRYETRDLSSFSD